MLKWIILFAVGVDITLSIINNLKIQKVMTKQEQFDANLERLNAVTNNIAADEKKLLEEIKSGTVSDESIAKLTKNIETLEAIAADVEDPIPATLPTGDTTPPADGGAGTGTTPPADGGATPPADGGATPPADGGQG